jgi:hypothetical protein
MEAPTREEIEAEVEKLKEMEPNVRQFSKFDDNRAAIRAQIEVLEEALDESEIFDRFEDADDPDAPNSIMEAAQEALRWMEGEEDEAPSLGWKHLSKDS